MRIIEQPSMICIPVSIRFEHSLKSPLGRPDMTTIRWTNALMALLGSHSPSIGDGERSSLSVRERSALPKYAGSRELSVVEDGDNAFTRS